MFEFAKEIRRLLELLAQKNADNGADAKELYETDLAFPYFNPTFEYKAGDVVRNRETGQLCKCIQGYKGSEHPDVDLSVKSMWMKYHGVDADHAYLFEQPTMAEDMYKVGEMMTFEDGLIYRAKVDTNFSPKDYPDAWEIVE